jgi:hypothetical protein
MCVRDVKSLPRQLLMLTPAEYCLDYTHKTCVGEVAAQEGRYRVYKFLSNRGTSERPVTCSTANRVTVGMQIRQQYSADVGESVNGREI